MEAVVQRDGRISCECAQEWRHVLTGPDFRPEQSVEEDIEPNRPVENLLCGRWWMSYAHRQACDRGRQHHAIGEAENDQVGPRRSGERRTPHVHDARRDKTSERERMRREM